MQSLDEIIQLFEARGGSEYGGEQVTQLEHALQAAMLAEREHAPAPLVVAALLHDLGHLLHELPADAPDRGIDDRHENTAIRVLRGQFPDEVTEPIRLHVAAKRYLCAVEPEYRGQLSDPSLVSLELQGGSMTADEVADFRRNPHHEAAVRLRRWDDAAKIRGLATPPLSHFVPYLQRASTALDS